MADVRTRLLRPSEARDGTDREIVHKVFENRWFALSYDWIIDILINVMLFIVEISLEVIVCELRVK